MYHNAYFIGNYINVNVFRRPTVDIYSIYIVIYYNII